MMYVGQSQDDDKQNHPRQKQREGIMLLSIIFPLCAMETERNDPIDGGFKVPSPSLRYLRVVRT